jgi:paraquat-inducible protein A
MEIDLWSMPEVFLLGTAVGYSRISVRLHVAIGWGGYCFLAAALLAMLSRAVLDRRTVWRMVGTERQTPADEPAISCTACDLVMPASTEGKPCPRCGARLHVRKPHSMIFTAALVIAGFILFAPANLYPMNMSLEIGKPTSYTIFDGVRDLFQAGLAPLGILIFCTSIAIPLAKLLGLSWFMLSVRHRSARHLVTKTKLYRLIDEIGRWSNVDPFTIAVIVPLFRFPPLVESQAGIGATAFIGVVVITMVASRVFDPRLMWDAAEGARP